MYVPARFTMAGQLHTIAISRHKFSSVGGILNIVLNVVSDRGLAANQIAVLK